MQDTNQQSNSLVRILEHLRNKDKSLGDLVALFLGYQNGQDTAAQNIFEPRDPRGFHPFQDQAKPIVNNLETLVWPIIGSHLKSSQYLPIRALRGDAATIWGPVEKLRIFLSSGTTSGPEGRSKSAYSSRGIDFYRAGSIAAFLGVLERSVLPFSGEFLNTSLVSLIPTVDEWPDSSLAQMLGWFSEIWPTVYANSLSRQDVFASLEKATGSNKPVVLFGTAFHFVNAVDQGLSFNLPPGSIIVETGGTKGQSRSVTREDLYQLLGQRFGINESRIVSEYGMCELASQAWDFVDAGQSLPLSARSFRFPWWVRAGVMTSPSNVDAIGIGALTIDDPLRVDLGQSALQTEDLASLQEDGSFKLLGRVPRAPLKGCSLKVSDITDNSGLNQVTQSRDHGPSIFPEDPNLAKNASKARQWCLRLLADTEALNRLQKELGDNALAVKAISDLSIGIPRTDDGFVMAARVAINHKPVVQNWLLIAPSSHSVAPIHPIAAAMTLGLNLRIRLPEIAGLKSTETFLARAVELASEAGIMVKTLPPSFRLGPNDLLDGENILVFGDDDTCAFMGRFAPGRVAAFGTAASICAARAEDLKNKELLSNFIDDHLSLAQRGCLSARALIVFGGQHDIIRNQFVLACNSKYRVPTNNPAMHAARAMEEVRLLQAGFMVNSGDVMVATKNSTIQFLGQDLGSGISRMECVIPVLILPDDVNEADAIKEACQIIPIRAISAGETIRKALLTSKNSAEFVQNLLVVGPGMLQCQPFDGTHLGHPFFGMRQ